ncbi:uncharacterized protein DSM5745_10819 [Aspergillus mulundensis]|uniref:Uncharacterized protein n=1 Tax=Aspergillus mulundensis TaxID=1810919 RepID=A0A3D8QF80_9EURO|nr:Uncharacterized protein DSM5745_10819 [Aspergillus mulundensis]RDW60361.1 Uncharacterized protein DSM5745_10819 [Aspergillus mulundensis]
MSDPQGHNEMAAEELESESEGTVLEVTFHYADCFDLDDAGYGGVILRRNREGDIISNSATPFVVPNAETIERAVAAAADATEDESRRPRIAPERPPRTPMPIQTWDQLARLSSNIEREREAAEIASSRELDNEPDQATWPCGWSRFHDYFLWTCRGTVTVITDHLQAVFRFNPAINETFVAERLCGVNAYKQLTFLQKYLPGEIHSLQRAEARGVVYEADISHPDVRMGTQDLYIEQPDAGDPKYIKPVLPCWAPPGWDRADDAFAALYLGEHPLVFLREYGWACAEMPTLEFVSIRMAQLPHLNLNWLELQAAKSRREFLVTTYPFDAGSYW